MLLPDLTFRLIFVFSIEELVIVTPFLSNGQTFRRSQGKNLGIIIPKSMT